MSLGHPSLLGLREGVAGGDLDPAEQALVSQQAQTLAAILQRSQTAVVERYRRPLLAPPAIREQASRRQKGADPQQAVL